MLGKISPSGPWKEYLVLDFIPADYVYLCVGELIELPKAKKILLSAVMCCECGQNTPTLRALDRNSLRTHPCQMSFSAYVCLCLVTQVMSDYL